MDVGKSVAGIIGIHGMYARFPAAGPVRTVATTKLSRKSFINIVLCRCSLVTIQMLDGLKFLSSGTPCDGGTLYIL